MTWYSLYKKDAVYFLQSINSSCVDLVITDPPYESMEKHRAHGTTTRLKVSKASSNEWFDVFPNERFPKFFSEVYRVLKPNTHFYLFCNTETMCHVKPMAESVGFKFWKPLVWDKMRIGMGYHYRARYEFILFFEKGKRKLNSNSIPDILQFRKIDKGYPTEKPVGLMKVLIEQSSAPGDLIVDPFAGSGAVLRAALLTGRNTIGNDLSENAHAHATPILTTLYDAHINS